MSIPRDTFLSSGGGQLTFKAQVVGDTPGSAAPLPSWMRFDPVTGAISGTPPADAPAVTHIQLIARDSKGNEATVTFTINNAKAQQGDGKSAPVKPQSKFKGEGPTLASESSDSFDERTQFERLADDKTAVLKAVTKGRVDIGGRASLSEQIRLANRHRASLDRLSSSHRVS
jgi:hypothetical protein